VVKVGMVYFFISCAASFVLGVFVSRRLLSRRFIKLIEELEASRVTDDPYRGALAMRECQVEMLQTELDAAKKPTVFSQADHISTMLTSLSSSVAQAEKDVGLDPS
jgi:hypothetical protein